MSLLILKQMIIISENVLDIVFNIKNTINEYIIRIYKSIKLYAYLFENHT